MLNLDGNIVGNALESNIKYPNDIIAHTGSKFYASDEITTY